MSELTDKLKAIRDEYGGLFKIIGPEETLRELFETKAQLSVTFARADAAEKQTERVLAAYSKYSKEKCATCFGEYHSARLAKYEGALRAIAACTIPMTAQDAVNMNYLAQEALKEATQCKL